MENEAYIILEPFLFFFLVIEHPGLKPKPLVTHQVVVDHCCCCCWKQLTSHCLCYVAKESNIETTSYMTNSSYDSVLTTWVSFRQ